MRAQEFELPAAFNLTAVFFFALTGAVVFAALTLQFHLPVVSAALYATAATVLLRVLAIIFNWKTRAVGTPAESS